MIHRRCNSADATTGLASIAKTVLRITTLCWFTIDISHSSNIVTWSLWDYDFLLAAASLAIYTDLLVSSSVYNPGRCSKFKNMGTLAGTTNFRASWWIPPAMVEGTRYVDLSTGKMIMWPGCVLWTQHWYCYPKGTSRTEGISSSQVFPVVWAWLGNDLQPRKRS